MLLPGWAKANIPCVPWLRLITSARNRDTRVSTKEEKPKNKKRESEKKKIEEGIEWREWMPDLRDKGIFQTIPYHYSACHVTPCHRSYKLTISQRSSVLHPSLSFTIRFLLFVSLPYLSAFTRAFISTDIYHDFPFQSILIQTFVFTGALHSSWVCASRRSA